MPTTAPPPPRRSRGREADAPASDSALTVLLVHNVYRQPGGEDAVFEREGALLEERGHRVLRYTLHNDAVEGMGRAALAARTVWSREAYETVRRTVVAEGVDVVHVHNTLPLASPSVFYGAHAGGAATVHTLHNYRLVCPGNLLLRDGAICHDCVGRAFAAPGVRHRCYRGSAAATAAVATATALHRAAGTWDRAVDRYITLSAFARDLFVEGGLPAKRVAVKHNVPTAAPLAGPGGRHALFAGRLVEGKGIELLLEAWASDPLLPDLHIAGDGELAGLVERAAAADDRIHWLGWVDGDHLLWATASAAVLVAPSTCYEGWPLVAVEAMGVGTPVVGTDHGAFPEMIADGETGRLVPRGDVRALAAAVRELTADPDRLAQIRERTARRFGERFSRDVNYGQLRAIYADALAQHAAR